MTKDTQNQTPQGKQHVEGCICRICGERDKRNMMDTPQPRTVEGTVSNLEWLAGAAAEELDPEQRISAFCREVDSLKRLLTTPQPQSDEAIVEEFYSQFTQNCDKTAVPPVKCPHLKSDDDANAIANYIRTILTRKNKEKEEAYEAGRNAEYTEDIKNERLKLFHDGYEAGRDEYRTHTKEVLIEGLRGMKYEDPREKTHESHPDVKWSDCEACQQNFHHNSAIDQAIQLVENTLTNNQKET